MGIKWKEDYSAKTQRIFGLGIGLGSGSLVGLVLAKGWPDVNWLLDWTTVAAVATFAASWSALHISQIEGRRRLLLERSVATIAVGATVATLSKYEAEIRGLLSIRALGKIGETLGNTDHNIHNIIIFNRHQSLLIELKNSLAECNLEKMIILPDGFSGRVSAIGAEAVLLSRSLEITHTWLRYVSVKGHIRDQQNVIAYWSSLEEIYLEMADLLSIARKFFHVETGKELP